MLEPISVPIPEAARLLGVGRSTIYKLLAQNALEAIHIGRRTLIPLSSLKQLASANKQEVQ